MALLAFLALRLVPHAAPATGRPPLRKARQRADARVRGCGGAASVRQQHAHVPRRKPPLCGRTLPQHYRPSPRRVPPLARAGPAEMETARAGRAVPVLHGSGDAATADADKREIGKLAGAPHRLGVNPFLCVRALRQLEPPLALPAARSRSLVGDQRQAGERGGDAAR